MSPRAVVRALGHLVRALCGLVATLALVAGLPWGLWHFVGWPLPHAVPGWDDLQTALTATDIPDEVLLKALAVPLWICWATLAGAILSEAAAALRGATLHCLPVIGPFQAVAATLVGTITLSVLTGSRGGAVAQETTRHAIHEQPQVVPVATAPAVPGPVAGPDGTAAAARAAPDLSSAPAPRGRGRAADRKVDAGPTYTVRKGDSLWRIAERTLGDGARYKQIAALNHGRPQADGRALTDDHWLRPGWELRLPPDAHGRADAGPAGRPVEHVVSEGDTLWDIAEAHLGDGASWPRIYKLNAHRPQPDGRSLTDPDLIHPGWVLRLPAPASGAKPTTSHAEGHPAPPSASPPASPPSPLDSAQGVPGDAPTPSPTATATPTSAPTRGPSSPPDAAPAERPGATDQQPGVDLPGGWVGLGMAAALVAAGGMVWLQRRRRYIPGQLAGPELNNPDLAPLPAALRLMRRRVRVQAPELLDPPPAQPTVAESAGPDPAPLPPIGPSGPDLAGLGALPPAGLGLAGPGAHSAARALLVAALSSGSPDDPDARGHVVIPGSALAELLGASAVDVGAMPRLRVAPNLTEAISHLEELIITRRRLLDEADAPDLAAMRAADPYHPPMPPVLLIAEAPGPDMRHRLSTTLTLGAPLQISAAVLGDWPPGETLRIEADGSTASQRVGVLDTGAALELLQMLREAHTGHRASHQPAEAGTGKPDSGASETRATEPPPRAVDPAKDAVEDGDADRAKGADHGPEQAPSAERPKVAVRVLGEPCVLAADGTALPGLRAAAAELLVYLAAHRRGADLADVMEALFPDATRRRASERLSTQVANLRNRIRHAASEPGLQPVVNSGSHYHLDPTVLTVDWWTVLDAITEASNAPDTARRAAALRRAINAYAGPLAGERDYEWIEPAREESRRQGVIIHTQLARLVSDTHPAEAARLLETACSIGPCNEEVACEAMRAHARLRDPAALRARLRKLRASLGRDLDIEPGPDTIALADRLLREIDARNRRPRAEPRREADDG